MERISEAPNAAMAREFREETGVPTTASSWQRFAELNSAADLNRGADGAGQPYVVHCFVRFADDVLDAATQPVEEDRAPEAIALFDPHHLPSHILPNLRWLIPAALQTRQENFFLAAEYGQ